MRYQTALPIAILFSAIVVGCGPRREVREGRSVAGAAGFSSRLTRRSEVYVLYHNSTHVAVMIDAYAYGYNLVDMYGRPVAASSAQGKVPKPVDSDWHLVKPGASYEFQIGEDLDSESATATSGEALLLHLYTPPVSTPKSTATSTFVVLRPTGYISVTRE